MPLTNASKIQLPLLPLPTGGLDIWWVPLPPVSYDHFINDFIHCLSQEEHLRLQSRRLPKGQFQFVCTRIMLRHILSSYHPEITPVQWHVGKSESGRPHLSLHQTPLSFNLAHTGDCLIFAFSQYADPGIDLEVLSRSMEFDEVARRFFSAKEYSELQCLPVAERAEFFYRLWTLKEAAVKACGLGLAKGMRRFKFSQPGTAAFSHRVDAGDSEALSGDFQFWSACSDGYVIAAALRSREGVNLPDVLPVSRRFNWPDTSSEISPEWTTSQSRNSSTNFEP